MNNKWFILLALLTVLLVSHGLKHRSPATNESFTCNESSAQTRAYVLVAGLGFTKETLSAYNNLLLSDPKAKAILKFDYDDYERLESISQEFINEFNNFTSKHSVDELVIIGYSAGGLIISYSLGGLSYNSSVKVHTIASPLRGCNGLTIGTGMFKEVGVKQGPFIKPPINFKVYHHKTVNDQVLSQWCSPLIIQDNNVPGSEEYYYPAHNHYSIQTAVTKSIINCKKN